MRISCTADGGSFHFTFRGQTSDAISHSDTYGNVKAKLEKLKTVDTVTISFSTGSTVCGSSEVITSVTFTQDFGPLPSAKVWTSTTDALTLTSSTAVLKMYTISYINCPACASCTGSIFLEYRDQTTVAIASSASAADIDTALEALSTIDASDITVTLSSGATMCAASAITTTITFMDANYGNLPNFTLINGMYDTVNSVNVLENITVTGSKGTKEGKIVAEKYYIQKRQTCSHTHIPLRSLTLSHTHSLI
jgi:hypothetical protein